MDYTLDHVVTLDTENGQLICKTSYEVQVKAQEMINREMGTRKSGDITRIVQKLFKVDQIFIIQLPQMIVQKLHPHLFTDLNTGFDTIDLILADQI